MRSGKSDLTMALVAALPASESVAFGQVTKREAIARGYGDDRRAKQRAGTELIAEGWPAFVARLLQGVGDPETLIVDGVRHVEAVDELASKFPTATALLVFIDPSDDVRHERMRAVGEDPIAEQHPVEQSLPEVRERADLVLSDLELEANVRAILDRLSA